MGTGATYFQHTGDRSATAFFIKHLNLELRDLLAPGLPGIHLKLGRFAYQDGLETLTGEPKLDWVKRVRGSERLLGPFGWSAFQRSFDGVQVSVDQPRFNWTTMVSRPTQGGFEEKAGETIDPIGLLAASLTLKPSARLPHTAPRLFYLRYDDERNVSQRVDNVAAAAPKVHLAINTYGVEATGAYPIAVGELDLLGWVALQEGDWYELDHSAIALAVEGGYQWTQAAWKPHVRAGWLYGSGDSEPGDRRHGTFFQILPTARKYAQLPFYNLMNSSDLFVQGFLKPHKDVTVRADWHWLSLAERNDRWYSGAGATQERGQLFGFVGRHSQGKRGLGHLVDLAVTYTPTPFLTLYGYYGHVFGGSVIEAIYAGASANFAYLEAELRF
ncbi:MAG: alginate export family protein [Candidatus Omnitrophica bacterium]|nr:alginate export family protein [Candidatus Omnitrophota bacterium]